MKKVLIVSPINEKIKVVNGGVLCNKNNINILTQIFGENNVDVYEIPYFNSHFSCFMQYLLGYCDGLNRKIEKEVLKKSKNYDLVFLNTVKFGRLCRKISKPTCVFSHNFEYSFTKQYINSMSFSSRVLHLPMLYAVHSNEKIAMKYASFFFPLNQRDSDAFHKFYGRKGDFLLTMSFPDRYNELERINAEKNIVEPYILFVGSNFWGNTDGLFWFIENVLDKIKIKLIVAGSGMDIYRDKYPNKNVDFLGFVDNLSKIYYQATAFVLPIISGGGMKTKTAEALMYGKTIFGTKEAFEGYDFIDNTSGVLCDSAESFALNITQFLQREKCIFNSHSREIFLEHYEDKVLANKLGLFLAENNIFNEP